MGTFSSSEIHQGVSKINSLKENILYLEKLSIPRKDSLQSHVLIRDETLPVLKNDFDTIANKFLHQNILLKKDFISLYLNIHKYLDSIYRILYSNKDVFFDGANFHYPFYEIGDEDQYEDYLSLLFNDEFSESPLTLKIEISSIASSIIYTASNPHPEFLRLTKNLSSAFYPSCFGRGTFINIPFYSSNGEPSVLSDIELSIMLAKHRLELLRNF